jgi:hypothetical protein
MPSSTTYLSSRRANLNNDLERVHALGRDRKNLSVLCHTLPESTRLDGLLGLDFMRGHLLSVDFRAGRMALE